MRTLRYSISLVLVLSAPVLAQTQGEAPAVLWKGLATGMTAEQALPVITAVEGVKRARVLPERKAEASRRFSISYKPGHIPIGGMSFDLYPHFQGARLAQVWLHSRDGCGTEAVSSYQALSDGLRVKYPQRLLGGEAGLTEVAAGDANYQSLGSGNKAVLTYAYGNDDVVVLLTYRIWAERPPAHPGVYTPLANALWQLGRTQFENRKAECDGTGDRRMDVFLQYMPRRFFNAEAERTASELKDKRDKLIDQL